VASPTPDGRSRRAHCTSAMNWRRNSLSFIATSAGIGRWPSFASRPENPPRAGRKTSPNPLAHGRDCADPEPTAGLAARQNFRSVERGALKGPRAQSSIVGPPATHCRGVGCGGAPPARWRFKVGRGLYMLRNVRHRPISAALGRSHLRLQRAPWAVSNFVQTAPVNERIL
jgi:hypothetical protein